MPFIIPAMAIGAGFSLIVWGSRMILRNDDSADEKAAEILSRIPAHLRQYIDNVTVSNSGVQFSFRIGTPAAAKNEIKQNIRPG